MATGVSKKSWAFKAELKVEPGRKVGMRKAELEFEGLDTFAEVSLVRRLRESSTSPGVVELRISRRTGRRS